MSFYCINGYFFDLHDLGSPKGSILIEGTPVMIDQKTYLFGRLLTQYLIISYIHQIKLHFYGSKKFNHYEDDIIINVLILYLLNFINTTIANNYYKLILFITLAFILKLILCLIPKIKYSTQNLFNFIFNSYLVWPSTNARK